MSYYVLLALAVLAALIFGRLLLRLAGRMARLVLVIVALAALALIGYLAV